MGSGLDDHIVRARGILPYLLGSLARALLRTSAFLALRYDLHTRITVATLGGAQGNVRPSAWLRTCGSGPWTSSRVTFGPTPKNENEMKMKVYQRTGGGGTAALLELTGHGAAATDVAGCV